MGRLHRLIVAVSLTLLAAGAFGAISHATRPAPSGGATAAAPAATATAATAGPAVPAVPAVPAAPVVPARDRAGAPVMSDDELRAALITPTDMGGYYRPAAGEGAQLLGSSPCLAGVSRAAGATGGATTTLVGPDAYSLPLIVEAVSTDSAGGARPRFGGAVSTLEHCRSMTFAFGGRVAVVTLAPLALDPVGDDRRAWQGQFTYAGWRLEIQVGLVLEGPEVLGLVWIDTVPGADAVMGSFASTLSLAIGKLA